MQSGREFDCTVGFIKNNNLKKKSIRKNILSLSLIAVVTFLMLISSGQPPLYGASRNRRKALEAQKRQNAEKIAHLRALISEVKRKKGDVAEQIEKVDAEHDEAVAQLNVIVRQEKILTVQHQRLTVELGVVTDKFRDSRNKYMLRLVSYYKDGRVKYLELLFATKNEVDGNGNVQWNFMDFVNRLHYLSLLARRDIDIMSDLKEKREAVTVKKQQVADKKDEVEENKDQQTEEKQHIEVIAKEKRKVFEDLSRQEDLLEREEAAEERANIQIEHDLASLMRSSGARNLAPRFAGRLGNPVCSGAWTVTSGFGPRRRPTRGASSYHKGIDLHIVHGQSVCAAAAGTVIYAGYKRGYGNTLMIAHSRDLVTLYGHGLGFPPGIHPGVVVKKGQVVMYGDSTGVSTGDHLHFTVFKNDAAVNPMGFF